MALTDRLESWSKVFDNIRWETGEYDVEAIELADLLKEAAQALRGYQIIVDRARHEMARH